MTLRISSFLFLWAVILLFFVPLYPAWGMAKRPPVEQGAEPRLPLQPLTLDECYELALRRSESLARRKVDIDKTWADFLKSTGEAIGDVHFEILHFRQEEQGSQVTETGATATLVRSSRRTRQFVITQPLFRGFRSVGALAGAGSLREQRVQEWVRAEQTLFLEVARAFYGVLLYEEDMRILKEIISLLGERTDELIERERIGRSRLSEAVTARTRMKTAEAQLAQIRGVLASERRVLEFLTGIELEGKELREDSFTLHIPQPLETYLAWASSRPDVEAAYQATRTAAQNIVIAQSGLWPEISLQNHLYEKREGFQSGIDWDLLFTIDIPLFKGGETVGEIKAAMAERRKAKLFFEESLRRAELEIKQAYDAWIHSVEESKALQEAVQASEENYRLQREDYVRNLVNNLDVLQALESVNDTRLNLARSSYEQKLNFRRLQVATGICCESRRSSD